MILQVGDIVKRDLTSRLSWIVIEQDGRLMLESIPNKDFPGREIVEIDDSFIRVASAKKYVPDSSYFIPTLEDIRVGYECEIYRERDDSWWDLKAIGQSTNLLFLLDKLKQNKVRVPYLTKEQIEAEGWIQDYPSPNGYLYYFTKVVGGKGEYNKWGHYEGTRYFLKYYKNDKWLAPLEISQLIPENPDERDSREYRSDSLKFDCKDINTFRYICKLLKIN